MKRKRNLNRIVPVICMLMLTANASGQDSNPCLTGGQTCYFAVEINGVLCGYSADTYCNAFVAGESIRYENSDVFLKMKALGAEMNGGFKYRSLINLRTGRAERSEISVINGESVVHFITLVSGDTAYYSSPTSGVTKTIPLGKDVILSSLFWYPHLIIDLVKNGEDEKKYRVYDPIKGEIIEKGYAKKHDERIILRDSSFNTMVVEETDYSTGLKSTLWLNKSDGYNVRTMVASRNIYLTDKSVTSRVSVADLDNELFCSVDKAIPDFMNLSMVRVNAKINSYGDQLTAESLNGRGQKFTGTVTGSLIEGTFETELIKYDGRNSPPFPPEFSGSIELEKYLSSEVMIECHEPEIIALAEEVTAKSKDSWEAVVRLSKWVSSNIAGVLPGGISAINTLRTRGAECGGHSRLLAALCRAVGIPARVVVGCMFTNYGSGGFGQHAWTEIYMGENGWIPVDATIFETDYIDAGHIRLGENATFRPVAMTIFDYTTGPTSAEEDVPVNLRPILGSYMNVELYRMFKIIFKNGGISIDIPGRMVLDLNPPDGEGKWYPKLTREISLLPEINQAGVVNKISMYQYFRLQKTSSPDSTLCQIPAEFREYAGTYQFQPAKLTLDVMFNEGVMTTRDPTGRSNERISYTKTGDTWIDETESYEIRFNTGSDQKIAAMNFTVRIDFLKGEPVSSAVEEVIKISGVDAGLKKYDEIKKSGNSNYFFSEHMLHQLGHYLLKDNRIDDAIKIFSKNVSEYPGSFMANDALAETCLRKGEKECALKYFKVAVKLNPGYEYGRKMINELSNR